MHFGLQITPFPKHSDCKIKIGKVCETLNDNNLRPADCYRSVIPTFRRTMRTPGHPGLQNDSAETNKIAIAIFYKHKPLP